MATVIKTFSTPSNYYVYDRETNSVLSVNQDEFSACRNVEMGKATEDDWSLLQKFTLQGYLKDSRLRKIEHPSTKYLKHYLEGNISQITIQICQSCNLRCTYCSYSGKYDNQREHSDRSMDLEKAKKCIDFFMARSRNAKNPSIGFYGGEPLMEIDKIKSCIDYIDDKYEGHNLSYTITTNGTILDENFVKYAEDKKINIAISLDGPKELHDKNRKYGDGSGSFDVIMKNIMKIKNAFPKFYKQIHFMTTVAPAVDLSCINEFYSVDTVMEDNMISFNTLSLFNIKDELSYDDLFYLTDKFQTTKVILSELGLYSPSKTSKLYNNYILNLARFYMSLSNMRMSEVSHPGGPCIPGIMRPFIDVDGYIYPCERVSEGSDVMKIGHIDTGFNLEKVAAMLNVGKLTELECMGCWSYTYCSLCVAASDGGNRLSGELRIKHCRNVQLQVLNTMRAICLLLENDYDFATKTLKGKAVVQR